MGPGSCQGSLDSARRWGLPVDELDATALRSRFPWFAVPDDAIGAFEANAGIVRPEATVNAAVAVARTRGAELRVGSRVRSIVEDDAGVTVETDEGPERAAAVIVAAGAWTSLLMPELAPLLTVTRQVQAWFAPTAGTDASAMPCWLFDRGPGRRAIYGLAPDPLAASGADGAPSPGRYPKVGLHGSDVVVDPDTGAQAVDDSDIATDQGSIRRASAGTDRRPDRGGHLPVHDVARRELPGRHTPRLHAHAFRCRALRPWVQARTRAGGRARGPRAPRSHRPAGRLSGPGPFRDARIAVTWDNGSPDGRYRMKAAHARKTRGFGALRPRPFDA